MLAGLSGLVCLVAGTWFAQWRLQRPSLAAKAMEGAVSLPYALPQEIYYEPQSTFVAKFVDRANFLKGSWTDKQTFLLTSKEQTVPIRVTRDCTPFHSQSLLPVRPEQIRLRQWHRDSQGITGTVKHVQFQGRELLYSIQAGEEEWEVVTDIRERFDYGQQVAIEICV